MPPPSPRGLTVIPATLLLQRGAIAQLVVTALLPNAQTLDVSLRTAWTIYRSSAASVATIDSNELVTAVDAGTATISVMNGQAQTLVPVTVQSSP